MRLSESTKMVVENERSETFSHFVVHSELICAIFDPSTDDSPQVLGVRRPKAGGTPPR